MESSLLHRRHRRPLAPRFLFAVRDALTHSARKYQHLGIVLKHSLHAQAWIGRAAFRRHIGPTSQDNQLINETSRTNGNQRLTVQHIEHSDRSEFFRALLDLGDPPPKFHSHGISCRRSIQHASQRLDVDKDVLDRCIFEDKEWDFELIEFQDDIRLQHVLRSHHEIRLKRDQRFQIRVAISYFWLCQCLRRIVAELRDADELLSSTNRKHHLRHARGQRHDTGWSLREIDLAAGIINKGPGRHVRHERHSRQNALLPSFHDRDLAIIGKNSTNIQTNKAGKNPNNTIKSYSMFKQLFAQGHSERTAEPYSCPYVTGCEPRENDAGNLFQRAENKKSSRPR